MLRQWQNANNLTLMLRTCLFRIYENEKHSIKLCCYTQIGRRCLQTSEARCSSLMLLSNRKYLLGSSNHRRLEQRAQQHKMAYLSKQNAQELICNLTDTERDALKEAIGRYESFQMKKDFEGKLAAIQWRTRFRGLSRAPSLGDVDPTGTFCAFPEDWLKNKLVQNAIEPARRDLWKIFFVNATPFLVFGFLDNFTMIICGDWIESGIGCIVPISTMAAAGFGNTISDILGLGSAVYVERGCVMMGLKPPMLTPAQFDLKSCRRATNWGRIWGITIGCLIGMFPLLLLETTEESYVPKKKCDKLLGINDEENDGDVVSENETRKNSEDLKKSTKN